MGDNPLFSSFMMLNEHLYNVFVDYILSGRTRAPPMTELIEMVPTFQFGARTDRKALQSKFRSWAKRMDFENGCLMLANTGKIIVPKEKCDDLVMYLHSSDHQDIENVITQIQTTYSWTKKNFGMDRDVVIDSIMRNCKRNECLKKLRMEIARLGNSLCSGLQDSQATEVFPNMVYGMPPLMPCLPPYNFPIAFPFPPLFPPSGVPFEIPLINMCDMGNPMVTCTETKDSSMIHLNNALGPENVDKVENKTKENRLDFKNTTSDSNSNAVNRMPVVRFKKPKNLREYKILVEAVKQKPEEYPTVLGDRKTQYLASLGIAPKSICSSRTLKKFRKELRSRLLLNRNCVVYRNRKVLRDKNKLKKVSGQAKRHIYLGMSKAKNPASYFSDKVPHDIIAKKQSSFHKSVKKIKGEQNKVLSTGKTSDDGQTKEPIEVITIPSSDEESVQECTYPLKTNTQNKEATVSSNLGETEILTDKRPTETTVKQVSDSETDISCSEEKNKQTNDRTGNGASGETENIQRKHMSLQVVPDIVERTKKMPLAEIIDSSVLNRLTGHSNKSSVKNFFSNSDSSVPNLMHKIILQNHSAKLLQTNPNPVAIHRISPLPIQTETLPMQTGASSASSSQNGVTKTGCQALESNIPTTSKFFVVGKEQNGRLYLIPRVRKPEILQKFARIQPKVTDDSNITPLLAASQLYQTKLNSAEKENAFYGKLYRKEKKDKIDINEEMSRITNWIYRMKSQLNPCMLTQEVEKSAQKLLSQLDLGLYLVKEAKRSLEEIENIIDIPQSLP